MYVNMTTNLMVENVEKSIAFYQEVLDFSVITSVPNEIGRLQFAILTNNNLTLMMQERSNFITEYPILETAKVHPSISLYIKVTEFDKFYRELKKKTTIYTEQHLTFYGTKEFAIADINGYVLTFTEHIEV